MNDKSELLSHLKIDRGTGAAPAGRGPLIWLLPLTALIVVVIAYLVLRAPAAVEIKTVTARAVSTSSAPASVLDASGYVVARRQATVSSKVTGKVMEVLIEEGQHVKQGQVLARIDDSNTRAQLALTRAQLAQVNVQLADAERTAARNRDLAAKKLVSQQLLDTAQANVDGFRAQLESARRSVDVQQHFMDDTIVRAPFAGVITQKNAQPGEMISPLSAGGAGTRTGIGTLVDMDSLEVEVDVNESYIGRVQSGQPATAKLNAYPDWDIPAEVIAVIPTADRSKATVKVRIGLKTHDARILPDMGVRVSFQEAKKETMTTTAPAIGVLVPADAVQADGDSGVVFVAAGEKLERRAVRLGGSGADGVRVVSGLAAGEHVALGDLTKFSDGLRVKIAP